MEISNSFLICSYILKCLDSEPNLTIRGTSFDVNWTNFNENSSLCSGRVTLSVLDLETTKTTKQNCGYENNNNNTISAPVRQKKYSHPAYYDSNPQEGQNQKQNSPSSPPNTPRLSARSPNRRKKHSLPNCATLPVPIINDPYEEGTKIIVARFKMLG